MPWQAIPYVTSGLTLVAFIAALAAWVWSRSARQRERMLEAVPKGQRALLVQDTLQYLRIDATRFSEDKQYEIARDQIRNKQKQFYIVAIVSSLFMILLFVVAVVTIALPNLTRDVMAGQFHVDQAASGEIVRNPQIYNHPADICATVGGLNDCSDGGQKIAATAVCHSYGYHDAIGYEVAGAQGSAEHLVSPPGVWQLLPTGAIFSLVKCTR